MSNGLLHLHVSRAAKILNIDVSERDVKKIDELLIAARRRAGEVQQALQSGERVAPSQLGTHGHVDDRNR